MPSLKDLKNRQRSILATKKITSAMKMIAAAKLKKAQAQAYAARPYTELMAEMLGDFLARVQDPAQLPAFLVGREPSRSHMLIVTTSNRGLSGGFNSSLIRMAEAQINKLQTKDQEVKIYCIGRKGKEQLARRYHPLIIQTVDALDKPRFHDASRIAKELFSLFENQEFDSCSIIYNKFVSALTQKTTSTSLIPFKIEQDNPAQQRIDKNSQTPKSSYEYEPSEPEVLNQLLPRNLAVQIYHTLLENAASEQGARMSAMDTATRNANDMLKTINLTYNRTRQAYITKELIEIISGAETL
ncbi:ATP synthase F0F1 subunit gamma [Candidatus Paracaedimonas acanthamoebae]|nr:ATP synthase F0F1 subunit gamma [Candidatus Paracaedimonas acanthamoebae]